MDEGWAFLAAALESDGFLQFSGIRMVSAGYVRQESERLINRGESHSS